jgi:16S rRNA (cytosine967-C5)-methyltransferase
MNARALAIQILGRVRSTDAYLNLVLDAQLAEHDLKDSRDAALVTELCYGATRRQLALDYAIAQFADRRLEKLEDRVLAALRIGAYQMFYLRIPRRAAVSETIEALKQLRLSRSAGFVNAVLRRLAELDAIPLPVGADPAVELSIRESHPLWLVQRWVRQFGTDRTRAMLAANNQPPPLAVRTNLSKISRSDLLGRFEQAHLTARPTAHSRQGILLQGEGKPDQLPGYAQGLWQVQDEAAQLVIQFADFPKGSKILDACAAPGGKACHLAERCLVVATDNRKSKLQKLEAEAKRLGVSAQIQTHVHDATSPFPATWGPCAGVLVDAPCSGLGTLRRHPELRYRVEEDDIRRLSKLQQKILENSQAQVAPAGLLVYSVCSTDPEEGQDVVEIFLRSHPEFTVEVSSRADQVPQFQGFLRTLPGPEGMDGFFAARLRRLY